MIKEFIESVFPSTQEIIFAGIAVACVLPILLNIIITAVLIKRNEKRISKRLLEQQSELLKKFDELCAASQSRAEIAVAQVYSADTAEKSVRKFVSDDDYSDLVTVSDIVPESEGDNVDEDLLKVTEDVDDSELAKIIDEEVAVHNPGKSVIVATAKVTNPKNTEKGASQKQQPQQKPQQQKQKSGNNNRKKYKKQK